MEALTNAMQSATTLHASAGSMIFYLAIIGLSMVVLYKIFEKAGIESWKAFIPFYNYFVLYELVWGNGFYALLLLIPIANIIVSAITAIKLAKAFGKGTGFAVGIFFIPIVFEGILAFGDAKYEGVPA